MTQPQQHTVNSQVVVIGAGPAGTAAAIHLLGERPMVKTGLAKLRAQM
jgi:cation diffusion facilitator CzcD-associated flavoprotein CzcO